MELGRFLSAAWAIAGGSMGDVRRFRRRGECRQLYDGFVVYKVRVRLRSMRFKV